MYGPQHLAVLFIFISVASQGDRWKTELSPDYCGLQHADDYVHEINRSSIDEFPWVAGLLYKLLPHRTLGILCAGTVINRRYVLTAAQCLLTRPQENVLVAVRLGDYHLQNETDCAITTRYEPDCTEAVDFGIEEFIVHSGYNAEKRINDIALLRLDRTINEFSGYIRPICLYPVKSTYANTGNILYGSGYGLNPNIKKQTEFKKKITTSFITNDQCGKEFPGRVINENHLCTRDLPETIDYSCDGDAGAPVMFFTDPPPKWHLEGVYSWGGKCGSAQPHVYTRVSKYLEWIEENIRDYSNNEVISKAAFEFNFSSIAWKN